MGLLDEAKPTPRNRFLGLLADAAQSADEYANAPGAATGGKANPPLAMLADLLGVGSVARTLDRLSYGEPITNYGKANVPLIPQDTAAAAMAAIPVAQGLGKGAVATAKFAGPKAAGMAEDYMARSGLLQPATVWHGSPHKFDRFDSSKIGTGEGKQQQGVGSYFADAKDVGQKYADKESWRRGMDAGYLYKVDVPDSMIAAMANHDAPLSAQPHGVRNVVSTMLDDESRKALRDYHGWSDPMDAPFAAVMDAMEIANGNNRAATSEVLRRAGIPGIRYLDGGSRGAGTGTSNYVVFPGEEGLLTILERNGVPLK